MSFVGLLYVCVCVYGGSAATPVECVSHGSQFIVVVVVVVIAVHSTHVSCRCWAVYIM